MPVASSTLVNIAEEAELKLVSLLAERAQNSNFEATCQLCITSGDVSQLVDTILGDKQCLSSLLAVESSQATGSMSILAALLSQVSANQAEGVVQALVDLPGDNGRKLVLLSVLYNMRDNVEEKCALLVRLFGLATAQDVEPETPLGRWLQEDSSSSSSNPRIVELLDSWKVSMTMRRHLYRAIIEAVESSSVKQVFRCLLVATYDANPDASGIKVAKEACVGALQDPLTHFARRSNLLGQPAVQALRQTDASLLGLLEIFSHGHWADYQKFLKDNNQVLSQYGLDAAQSERYIKILSLVSLAADHEEIPYQMIADTLQSDDVEAWVIAAVSSELLEAKMDQLAQKVLVERCVVRRFDMDQWKVLQARLRSWKENVSSVLETLEQAAVA